jgi:hypothetical protein
MYSKNGSYRAQKNIFSKLYPTILKWIEKQKIEKHSEFAIQLQKIESAICIDKICPDLDLQNIDYYTIHDAWLVKEEDIQQTLQIINENFIKEYNSKPSLKIEKLN